MRTLLALCLLVQGAPGGVKVGDKSTVAVESSLDLEITVRDGVGENRRLLSLVRKDRYVQVVTEASGGKAQAVKLICTASTLQKSGTATPIEEKATPLAGKSYLAAAGAEGWAAREPEGGAPPIEAVNLGAWNELSRLLPAAEPKTGSSWTVDGKELLPVLYPMAIASQGTGKIDVVCQAVEGGKATLQFKGAIQGKARDESVSKLSFTISAGTLVYDLARGRALSCSLTGELETVIDRIEVTRKAGTSGALEEERRKIGEIVVKSSRLEATFSFE